MLKYCEIVSTVDTPIGFYQSGAFCNTFDLYLVPFVLTIFVVYIFEWPFKAGFTVLLSICNKIKYTSYLLRIFFLKITVYILENSLSFQ